MTVLRGGERDISVFYDDLSPYGSWVVNARYGYVWMPRHLPYGWRPIPTADGCGPITAGPGFRVIEWGWIPFHYGRWGFDRSLGWFWVPDTVWGPAWVTWRTGDIYLGWAPLPPERRVHSRLRHPFLRFRLPPVLLDLRRRPSLLERPVGPVRHPVRAEHDDHQLHRHQHQYPVAGRRVYNEGFDPDEAWRLTRRQVTKYRLRDPGRPGASRIERDEVIIHKPVLTPNRSPGRRRSWGRTRRATRSPETSSTNPPSEG